MTSDREAVAASASGWSITTPVLFVGSCAVVTLLLVETVFGVLWQLGGDYRSYLSLVQ
jgi:hypothetical protein